MQRDGTSEHNACGACCWQSLTDDTLHCLTTGPVNIMHVVHAAGSHQLMFLIMKMSHFSAVHVLLLWLLLAQFTMPY